MKHSQKVHEAMRQAFKELLALSPTELRDKLREREVGPIGRLMQETQTTEALPRANRYDEATGSSLSIEPIHSRQEENRYIVNESDTEWLTAA